MKLSFIILRHNLFGESVEIKNIPFTVVDWEDIVPEEHGGEMGKAIWKVLKFGDMRIRIVEYTPGYIADHWCKKGHVIYILSGEMTTELDDGRKFITKQGLSYVVGDEMSSHRTYTKTGVRFFVVD